MGSTIDTLLVDLERHRLIDLLPDRTVDTLAVWLRAHPGTVILSRDCSTVYARGATRGAMVDVEFCGYRGPSKD